MKQRRVLVPVLFPLTGWCVTKWSVSLQETKHYLSVIMVERTAYKEALLCVFALITKHHHLFNVVLSPLLCERNFTH